MNARLHRRSTLPAVALAVTLISAACSGEDPQSTTPTGPSGPGNNMSSMTWEVSDGCRDGRGLQVRFFDRTYGGLWPSSSEVYLIPSGETRVRTLSCRTEANICYGARTDPDSSTSWGLDLVTGNGSCTSCCNSCRDTTVTRNLTCN